MQIEYHKWWSPNLGQDMELKVYGHYGKPALVFPCQNGRFYEYEDFKMVETLSGLIESGKIKLFTIDSIDGQSWANASLHPHERALRHEAYDRYVTQEVTPFMRQHCGASPEGTQPQLKFLSTGCSMGAYHSANFFFRHPDIFDAVIALSGPMDLRLFIGDYSDDLIYLNSPISYLPGLEDPWFLDQYRQSSIVICTGQGAWEEPMVESARAIQTILQSKGIPNWVDFWGYDVNHDWPWWRKMMPYYLETLEIS